MATIIGYQIGYNDMDRDNRATVRVYDDTVYLNQDVAQALVGEHNKKYNGWNAFWNGYSYEDTYTLVEIDVVQ